jgi:hypothetical protein
MCKIWANCRRSFVVDSWATVYSRLVIYMWMDKTVLFYWWMW